MPVSPRIRAIGFTMALRITCTACRTVIKVDNTIREEKKVRCTGCRIVILLTPDQDEPDGVRISYPKKTDKPKGMKESTKRYLMIAALAGMAIVVAIGLWYTLSGPKTHATVEGVVTLDNNF